MMEAMARELPLRNVVRFGSALTMAQLEKLLDVLSGRSPASTLPVPLTWAAHCAAALVGPRQRCSQWP